MSKQSIKRSASTKKADASTSPPRPAQLTSSASRAGAAPKVKTVATSPADEMAPLNELLLEELFPVDVHNVDVRRLRDDRDPIQYGDEVMFVAVAGFRPKNREHQLIPASLGEDDDIMQIRDDADI